MLPDTTKYVLIGTLVIWGLWDVFVLWRRGWEAGQSATISRVVLGYSKKYPIIPLLVGMLLGHLFIPQHPKPGELVQP